MADKKDKVAQSAQHRSERRSTALSNSEEAPEASVGAASGLHPSGTKPGVSPAAGAGSIGTGGGSTGGAATGTAAESKR